MIAVDGKTIDQVFEQACQQYAERPLIEIPADEHRGWYPQGVCLSFQDMAQRVKICAAQLQMSGFGHGHRIACLLENRPEMLVLKLACAQLGISWVPINPDYRPLETAWVLTDSAADLVVTVPALRDQMRAGIQAAGYEVPMAIWQSAGDLCVPRALSAPPHSGEPTPQSEASLLYTSGTTGNPKGCILSHEYELLMGQWYYTRGGALVMTPGEERVYNPLPLFHVNAAVLNFHGVMQSGNCQIIPARFSRNRWWQDIRDTRATGMHYLGVIVPVLMNEAQSEQDQAHQLRWGLGAGVEPTLHDAFEQRFGCPLVEVWGMTEMCRMIAANEAPRQTHTRAFGRPQPELEVRVVDSQDRDVAMGEPGELLVRHSEATPRKGAFSGYLNQPEATETVWRGGWFHTGDTVSQDETGMLYFIDRAKNIIRRSGENIAAAEIEACLQGHGRVAAVAVLALDDALRDEEVLACVVANGEADAALAQALFDHCFERLAYYKAPGWLLFVDQLPVTGTQKIQKHRIFIQGEDPKDMPNMHDFRALKKRR